MTGVTGGNSPTLSRGGQSPTLSGGYTGGTTATVNRNLAQKATAKAAPAADEAEADTDDDSGGSDDQSGGDTTKVAKAKRDPTATADTGDNSPTTNTDDTNKSGGSSDDTTPSKKQANSNNNDNSNNSNGDGSSDPNYVSQAELQALQRCESLRSAAESACKLTDDTDKASSSDSLTGTCKQSADKGIKSTNSKAEASSNCTQKFSQCADTCDAYHETYSDSPDAESFRTNYDACLNLADNSGKMIETGNSSYNLASAGVSCQENASESPQTAGGAGDRNAAKNQNNRNPVADALCAMNPTAPGCATLNQNQGTAAREAEGGFGNASANKGSMDVGGGSDQQVSSIFGDASSTTSQGAKNGTIANNSGGSIPGGGGGANANSGGSPFMNALRAVGNAITDIEQGYLGGGYAQLINGENPWADGPVSDEEISRAIASLGETPKPQIDPDLRRYLPGGDLARNGTFLLPYETEFHGMNTNIFEKIHDRYTVKCLLGELVGCPDHFIH